jgi:hypothetical protein
MPTLTAATRYRPTAGRALGVDSRAGEGERERERERESLGKLAGRGQARRSSPGRFAPDVGDGGPEQQQSEDGDREPHDRGRARPSSWRPAVFTRYVHRGRVYTLTDLGNGRTRFSTDARYRNDMALARLMEPLITPSARKKFTGDLARLKTLAEAAPPESATSQATGTARVSGSFLGCRRRRSRLESSQRAVFPTPSHGTARDSVRRSRCVEGLVVPAPTAGTRERKARCCSQTPQTGAALLAPPRQISKTADAGLNATGLGRTPEVDWVARAW